jgi:arsenate reductase
LDGRGANEVGEFVMADQDAYKVLFLCHHNAARSIIAEALLNSKGKDRFRAFSAGSDPFNAVDPMVADLFRLHGLPSEGYRPKSWNEFAETGAEEMDFIFTISDKTAGEPTPAWPGKPITSIWAFQDPHTFDGHEREKRALLAQIFGQIERRLDILLNLPLSSLDRISTKQRLDKIHAEADQGSHPASA